MIVLGIMLTSVGVGLLASGMYLKSEKKRKKDD